MDAPTAAPDNPTEVVSAPIQPPRLSHRILSGGAWSLLGRVGSMGSLFLMNVVLARSLHKDEYSSFLTAASVVPLLAILATLGVPWTLVRVVRSEVFDDRGRRDALRGAMTLTIIGGVATAAGYWLAASLLPEHAKWLALRDYRFMVAGWFTMSAICMVAANYLQAEDKFRAAALVGARSGGLIPNVVALTAVTAVASASTLRLSTVLALQLAAYLTALAAAVWYIRQRLLPANSGMGHQRGEASSATRHTAGWFFADSWPNLINLLISVMLTEVDLFWIACFANEETVANYGVVRNLRLLVTAPLLVASIALPPFVAELYGRRDLARLERLIRGAATALALPSLAALAVLLLAPETVIRLVYGESFVEAATALQIVAVGAVVFVLTGSNAMTLTMTGRHRDLMACSVVCLALYVVSSPPLVARYGLIGAAVAITLQTIVQNVLVTIRVRQTVGIWTLPFASWSTAHAELSQLLRGLRSPR